MLHLKKPIIFFIALTVLWLSFNYYLAHIDLRAGNKMATIKIGEEVFHVEVVSTPAKLEKGLGARKDLCDSCGMLFEFKDAGKYSFWMKDMQIALDIIWISQEKVVHIEKNIQPDFKGTLIPTENADKVLEINAGKVDEFGIKVGDMVDQL